MNKNSRDMSDLGKLARRGQIRPGVSNSLYGIRKDEDRMPLVKEIIQCQNQSHPLLLFSRKLSIVVLNGLKAHRNSKMKCCNGLSAEDSPSAAVLFVNKLFQAVKRLADFSESNIGCIKNKSGVMETL